MDKKHYTTHDAPIEIERITITITGEEYCGHLDDDGYASGLEGPAAEFNTWDYGGIHHECAMRLWGLRHTKGCHTKG